MTAYTPASLYDQLGGAMAVARLTDRFYELMDTLPQAAAVRAMHPGDLRTSRDKLYEFLCGWLGGPPLYEQKYGHPRLRARHLPFAIDEAARDQWLLCMRQAIAEQDWNEDLKTRLANALARTADFMRNQPA